MIRKLLVLVTGIFVLAACGAQTPVAVSSSTAAAERSYSVASFQFAAPDDLSVSEAEGYYPLADVVWRGDPKGDRIAQIEDMFTQAVARNEPVLAGDTPVAVRVDLVRFHGVTDRTRYSVGGNYNIIFNLTVVDARSGTLLEPTRRVVGNLKAPGGSQAVALEQGGNTQKVRVTSYLTALLRAELS
ncbi:DUF6778 family protein [Yoonia sp. BS5-3]|uniref:DUF6778 family protein n=1 Tax=Yoonia phaeophyticola TaxID=3137369 RepID=A0ABZ2V2Q6_9RHOB